MNNVFYLNNPGLKAVVASNNVVGIYTDTGFLYYTKKYSGNWEAKRGAEMIASVLNRNNTRGLTQVPLLLRKHHVKIDSFVPSMSSYFGKVNKPLGNLSTYISSFDISLGED